MIRPQNGTGVVKGSKATHTVIMAQLMKPLRVSIGLSRKQEPIGAFEMSSARRAIYQVFQSHGNFLLEHVTCYDRRMVVIRVISYALPGVRHLVYEIIRIFHTWHTSSTSAAAVDSPALVQVHALLNCCARLLCTYV